MYLPPRADYHNHGTKHSHALKHRLQARGPCDNYERVVARRSAGKHCDDRHGFGPASVVPFLVQSFIVRLA